MMKKNTSTIILLLAALTFFHCSEVPRNENNRLQKFSYRIGMPSAGNPWAKEKAIEVIDKAQFEIIAVFSDLNDADVAQALINAANRGIRVGVAGDQRNENRPNGFALLKNLRVSNKFLDQKTAHLRALAADNENTSRDILRTRLNFNRQNRSANYNAAPYDGRVEYNFISADSTSCWLSTGGANSEVFSAGGIWSVTFQFESYHLCRDLTNEGTQLTFGGLFGDEGKPSFGAFRHSKAQVDPNYTFKIDDLAFRLYFAPQEKPTVPIVNELMRAEDSIYFGARALTQDIINDVQNHSANRSHILNVLEYKARVPKLFKKPFTVKGIVGQEIDNNETAVPQYAASDPEHSWHKWASSTVAYNSLTGGSCPTINSALIGVPYIDGDDAFTYQLNSVNMSSIHCDLQNLRDSVNGVGVNSSALSFRKSNIALPFNVFLLDKDGRKPKIILMSSDLRRRYFYDPANSQDAEPKRTRNDYFPLTDAFVLFIEPTVVHHRKSIFDDFEKLLDDFYAQGANVW